MDKEKEIEELKTFLLEKSSSENAEPVFTDSDGNEHYLDEASTQVINDILEQAFIPFIAEEVINAGYGNVAQAVKEFAEELKKKLLTVEGIDDYQQVYVEDAIDELIKERFPDDTL